MSLSDWTLSTGAASSAQTATLSTSSPAQGSKCLAFLADGGITFSAYSVLGYAATPITQQNGYIRTMFREDLNASFQLGLFCLMQGSIALTNNCYGAFLDDATNLTVFKGAFHGGGGRTTLGSTVSLPAISIGSWYAISLTWGTNSINGNVTLFVSTDGPIATPGTYDYSTLVPRFAFTDASSPYGAGVSAGILSATLANQGSGTDDSSFDFTEIAWC